MMWYGVLGTKELLHRTYKNLEQKVLLEVSGKGSPAIAGSQGPLWSTVSPSPSWVGTPSALLVPQ